MSKRPDCCYFCHSTFIEEDQSKPGHWHCGSCSANWYGEVVIFCAMCGGLSVDVSHPRFRCLDEDCQYSWVPSNRTGDQNLWHDDIFEYWERFIRAIESVQPRRAEGDTKSMRRTFRIIAQGRTKDQLLHELAQRGLKTYLLFRWVARNWDKEMQKWQKDRQKRHRLSGT